jgi:hypothetical protein
MQWSRCALEFGCTGAGGLATHHLAFAFARCQGTRLLQFFIWAFAQVRSIDGPGLLDPDGPGARILIPAKLASTRAKAVVILG